MLTKDRALGLLQNKKSVLYFGGCCIIWCMFIYIVLQKGYTIFAYNTPKEVREMNTVVFAEHFAFGDNLYALSKLDNSFPVVTSMYGFLVPLVLAPFIRLFSFCALNALQICELVTLLVEIAGAVFFYRLLLEKTSQHLLSVIGMVFFYYCYWRYNGFGGAFPDQWGISLSVILMYILYKDRIRDVCRPAVYAAIVIGLFYIKQYFVLTAIGLCVYIFWYSKNEFKRLVLFGILEGIISVFLVYWIFPLYFSEALPIGQGQTSTSNIPYSVNQIRVLNEVYKGVIFFGILYVFIILYKIIYKKELIRAFSYEFCQLACILPPTIYIAQNGGTCYTYYLQLWYPYVVVCGIVSAARIIDCIKPPEYKAIRLYSYVIYCIALLFTFYQMVRVIPFFECDFMTNEEKIAWENSYNILDEYAEKGAILVPMLLSNYCLEKDMETADYGQAQFNTEKNLQNYKNSKLWTKLFLVRYTSVLLEKNIYYNNVQIKRNIENQAYSCIALTSAGDYWLQEDDIIDAGYHVLRTESLPSGGARWNVTFYVRD